MPDDFDASIDRNHRDGPLPLAHRQIAAFEQELGDRDEIHPAVLRPGWHVAADLPRRFRCRRRPSEVRRDPDRQNQSASAFAADIVEHPADPLDQRIHLRDPFLRRPGFEEGRETVEVQFEAVAVVAPHGFFDQPEDVSPDLVAAEIQGPAAQPAFRMINPKLRGLLNHAMIVVHAKAQQRFTAAPLCLREHDRIRVDARIVERLEIGQELLRAGVFSGGGRRRPDHRADLGRVVHDLRVDADQHRVDVAVVVCHFFDKTFDVIDGDRHRSLAARLGEHAATPSKL